MDETPVSAVTLQILNGLIEAQAQLRDAAEKRWAFAREALFNLARLVAADWLEEKQQKKGGLEVVRIEELSRVVFERVTALRTAYAHPDAEQLRKLLTRNDALRQELEKLTASSNGGQSALEKASQENARLRVQLESFSTQLALTTTRTPVAAPGSPAAQPLVPSWYQEWTASEGFEKQSFVIRLMGETGLSLRPEILKALTQKYEASRTSGACVRAFTHLVELEFILTTETEGGLPGRPPQTVRLSRLGESAYLLLTGKPPVQAKLDASQPARPTEAHSLLIQTAGQYLAADGYEIFPTGEPEGSLRVRKHGQELQIEVESEVGQGEWAVRELKWQTACDAGQGHLYVFCATTRLQKDLAQEIQRALASQGRLERASLYLTNLEGLDQQQRHPDGSLWLVQKRPARVGTNSSGLDTNSPGVDTKEFVPTPPG
jgi:hypothetical protein